MPDIAIVGEAWGQEEEKARAPFVGYSGQFLTACLKEAGISRQDCLLTNVFNLHPPGNDLNELCGPEATRLPGYPALSGKKYVKAKYEAELDRLGDELIETDPNVIIALGNTAMWAMLGHVGIGRFRGFTELSTHTVTGFKVLPTYHPAAVVRQVELRPTTILDFQKALRESAFKEIRRPSRQIFIPETIEDLHEFDQDYLQHAERIAVDIETSGNQVTCIGFAPDPYHCLVVPIADSRRKGRSYWDTLRGELEVWSFIRAVCARRTPKTFQNGLYDIAFLYRSCGIKVYGAEHDTMLLHHALQPESPKSLGFLGSIYTDEMAWKEMRGRTRTIKGDE